MDLVLAIIAIGCCCCVALFVGAAVVEKGSRRARRVAQLLAAAGLTGYFAFLWEQPLLATILPFSSLIILANWLPVLGSFFVGMYLSTASVSLVRRRTVSAMTVTLAAYSVVAPIFGRPPDCRFRPTLMGLQHQSTPFTCSAACAASLLTLHGIDSTEQEMAELCLTRQGTHWMGLYRGLKLKTAGTGWTVRVDRFSKDSLADLQSGPAVLSLNLDMSGMSPDVEHGFQQESGHSVLALGSPGDDLLTVFDPAPDFGLEVWGEPLLQHVTSGVVVRLIPVRPDAEMRVDVTRNIAMAQRSGWIAAGL